MFQNKRINRHTVSARPPTHCPYQIYMIIKLSQISLLWMKCSGDLQAEVPATSTKETIKTIKLTVKNAWHSWFVNGELTFLLVLQVGGYTEVYERDLTFATIRGAGLHVSSDQPARALCLIKHFLDGTPLPNTISNNQFLFSILAFHKPA